jgi:hypothetical protein
VSFKIVPFKGGTQGIADVGVYRDGEVVTVVGRGEGRKKTERGEVRTHVVVTRQYDAVEDYEADRDKIALDPNKTLAYVRLMSMIGARPGIDDDARRAPPLPEHLRAVLPPLLRAAGAGHEEQQHVGALPAHDEREDDDGYREDRARPFLLEDDEAE